MCLRLEPGASGWDAQTNPCTPQFLIVLFKFSYGLLFGIGCSMVRDTSSLMLSQYFKRKRDLAETLAATGSGVGIAIFSNVYQAGFR